ncbi:uncharacterized protein LOC122368194 [Amphibalanus amphitrite]|uniref:uncharacterized protein LOC122368194 n=1 Tax=Amphibalanus amphitrite TaxID=1232801 RepID=UPI001C907B33|nr:uncharacterized protein LOC122368194 [Amphibalanus amphitrite]
MSRSDIQRKVFEFLRLVPQFGRGGDARTKIGDSVGKIVDLYEAIEAGDDQQRALLREIAQLLQLIASVSGISVLYPQDINKIHNGSVRDGADLLRSRIGVIANILPPAGRRDVNDVTNLLYEALTE